MFYTEPPKKMLAVNILSVLRKYSDENHSLSQKDIIAILEKEYGMRADRKAVRRNLTALLECGYPLEYSETTRRKPDGEDETVMTDWYLRRDFTDAELRLLIDGLLFSKHIPYSQCKELVKKIAALGSVGFDARVRHIRGMPENQPENRQLFYTIEVLDEAISARKQAAFHYIRYDVDKRPHRTRETPYTVSPYQIAATNGRYYLLCNTAPHDGIGHYRLDRITDIRLLDEPARPLTSLPGCEHGLNLPRHMAEHIYMFSGPSRRVSFRADRGIVGDILDWFGTDVAFSDVTQERVTASVRVNERAMLYWALQYCAHAEVLEPEELRKSVMETLARAAARYQIDQRGG